MIRKLAFAILLPAMLAACETVPPYHPASGSGGYGFTEQKIEADRYRVTFNGNSSTSRQAVENFLLYRAAELTIESGNDYFVITENDTETHKSYSVTSRFPRYGRRTYWVGPREYYYNYPYYSYGFDWGYPYDRDIENVHEYTRYTAESYITVHRGTKPGGNANAFDAREVIENLGPFVEKSNEG
jgi:hypothetical protein